MIAAFLSGCATSADRLNEAARAQAEAGLVDQALAEAAAERELGRLLPAMPAECRQILVTEIRAGMRLDEAVLRLDRRVVHEQTLRLNCVRWYDDLRARLNPE